MTAGRINSIFFLNIEYLVSGGQHALENIENAHELMLASDQHTVWLLAHTSQFRKQQTH